MNWKSDLYELMLRQFGHDSELINLAEVQASMLYATEWR
jgi:hypothetical protein